MSPKICYVKRRFNYATQETIRQANTIIAEYTAQGYDLTLRQATLQAVSERWDDVAERYGPDPDDESDSRV